MVVVVVMNGAVLDYRKSGNTHHHRLSNGSTMLSNAAHDALARCGDAIVDVKLRAEGGGLWWAVGGGQWVASCRE